MKVRDQRTARDLLPATSAQFGVRTIYRPPAVKGVSFGYPLAVVGDRL